MNVVGHEAIGKYFNLECLTVVPEPDQICLSILDGEEYVFAPVATLRDVMGYTSKYCSG